MRLYSDLARAYHEMYRSLFDYKKEFRFYHGFLKKHGCRSVLEIGCGSGSLSAFLRRAGMTYTGLDLSADMLRIARREHPEAKFIQADMRNFRPGRRVDSVIITGRTLSHAITNEDVLDTLKSVHGALNKKGILVFDCFRADEMIRNLLNESIQNVKYGDTLYRRKSRTSLNLGTGWTFDWAAEYRIKKKGRKERIVRDRTVLRAFTEDELRLFLRLCGFDVLKFMRRKVYAIAARKADGPA